MSNFTAIIAISLSLFCITGCTEAPETSMQEDKPQFSQGFQDIGLLTNTSIHSIPLEDVLNGGPRKDGIPAINEPSFTTIQNAPNWLQDDGLGILVQHNQTQRYYPYGILNWHEIVNDTIDELNISVTFCPLCGTAIVYDRQISEDTITNFGVSGKLWESNLLMYDQETETLWSQFIGEAVVGDLTGQKLKTINSDIITFNQLKQNFPQAQVLSDQTGFNRAYDFSPYGDYDINDTLFFSASGSSESEFQLKELFVVAVDDNKQIGFNRNDLLENQIADIQNYQATVEKDGTITIINPEGKVLPQFVTMWFSWVSHPEKKQELEFIIWSN